MPHWRTQKASGKRIGSKLIELVEKLIKKEGHFKVTLDSTLTALKFYTSKGYIKTGDKIHDRGKVSLPCITMSKYF